MTVRNAQPYLRASIESVQSQTLSDFELIVVDDASEDGSAELAESISDPRIRVLRNSSQLRIAASLNRGIEAARAEFIARLDADDLARPERLERQLGFLEARPSIGVVGSAAQLIDSAGRQIGADRPVTEPAVVQWELHFGNPLLHSSIMIRRHLLAAYGGYDRLHGEDYELWVRLSAVTRLANIPESLISIRKHPGQFSREYLDDQEKATLEIMQGVITRNLGRAVPAREAGLLRAVSLCEAFGSPRAARVATGLIRELLAHYLQRASPSAREARHVRRRAAEMLLGLSAHNALRCNRSAAVFLGQSLATSPRWTSVRIPGRLAGGLWRRARRQPVTA